MSKYVDVSSLKITEDERLNFLNTVSGVQYIPSFISEEEEKLLITGIDGEEWSEELKRRTQQYGAKFNYRTRGASRAVHDADIPKLPSFLNFLTDRLVSHNIYSLQHPPDQLIINEYNAEQGIAKHVDAVKLWGPTVVTLSLGLPTMMRFTKPKSLDPDGKCILDVVLEPRSLVVLQGEARYDWQHGIERGNTIKWKGNIYLKDREYRRISLTFRTIQFNGEAANTEPDAEDY
eukprot:Phypoly_transcript_16313.p1 GENE.Phypoly_transcript_16313~~Phypoly_transcript_16313.p1  ORF type:complete len:233 (+),score=21.88 Phypoly_transcript_16313:24-722(+)